MRCHSWKLSRTSSGSTKMNCSASFSSAIITVLVTYLAYVLALVVYRLYYHPLAKFPGPRYAAISRWHEYYHEVVRKGQFSFVIQDYHRKYGKFCTYGCDTYGAPMLGLTVKARSSASSQTRSTSKIRNSTIHCTPSPVEWISMTGWRIGLIVISPSSPPRQRTCMRCEGRP